MVMSKKRKTVLSVLAVVAGTILAACLGVGAAVLTPSEAPNPHAAFSSASPAPPAANVQPSPVAVSKSTAPASPAASKPATIEAGTWTVGADIPPGTYRSSGVESMCYWAITKSGSNGSDIIANDLPSGGRPQVTLKRGQDFETSEECGVWTKIK